MGVQLKASNKAENRKITQRLSLGQSDQKKKNNSKIKRGKETHKKGTKGLGEGEVLSALNRMWFATCFGINQSWTRNVCGLCDLTSLRGFLKIYNKKWGWLFKWFFNNLINLLR